MFEVTPSGVLDLLYTFNGNDSTDAASPMNLAMDSKGNLYGDTPYVARVYAGIVFRLAPTTNGAYHFNTVLVASDSPQESISNPDGDIFWLNCRYEGDSECANLSTLNVTINRKNVTLWTFDSPFFSSGNLIVDKVGNVYGTVGGDGGQTSWGYVWEWSLHSGFSVLHTFDGTDGSYPDALRLDAAGNLYGTAEVGGTNNAGTAFEIGVTTGFATLYNFCSLPNCADGTYPTGGLTRDSKGNLYGTTYGTTESLVFKLTPGGVESVLYNSGSTTLLGSSLLLDKSGNLYGTTINGGTDQIGSVYKLTP